MNYDEKTIKQAQALHEHVRQLRGRMLNNVAVMELKLAELLAVYFCSEDRKQSLILSEVFYKKPFDAMVKLLRTIIEEDWPSYLDKNPELFTNFKKIQKFRNVLAHSTIDVSSTGLVSFESKQIVGFKSLAKGRMDVKRYTLEQTDDMEIVSTNLSSNIEDVHRLIVSGLKERKK